MKNWNWLVCLCVLAGITIGCSKKGETAVADASSASENTVASDDATTTGQENAEKPAEGKSILESVKGYFSKKEEAPSEEPTTTETAPVENTPAVNTDVADQTTSQPPAETDAPAPVEAPVDTTFVAQAVEKIKQAAQTSAAETPVVTEEEPSLFRKGLDHLRFKDKWSILWWGIIWLVFSVVATYVLEAHNPFKDDQKTKIAKAKSRHPFGAFGVIMVPFVLAILANMDRIPWGWGWLYILGIIAGYFAAVMAVWSMGIRWGLFVRETYDRPYNQTAEEFLKTKTSLISYRRFLIWSSVAIPAHLKDEWKTYWTNECKRIGTTFRAPRWRDHIPLITEWTILAPLSIQETVWRLFIADSFWNLMQSMSWIANWRSWIADRTRGTDLD